MKPKCWLITSGLLAVILTLQGCRAAETPTPMPTPAPLPEKSPPAIKDWGGFTVKTLCLESELNFPEWRDDDRLPQKIDDAARIILTRLGIKVVSGGLDCDATLKLKVAAEDICAFYAGSGGAGNCCTGGKVDGLVSLSAEGKEPIVFSISENKELSKSVESTKSEHCRVGTNDFKMLWDEPLVVGLAGMWGLQVYVFGMDLTSINEEKRKSIGLTEEVFTALLYALEDENSYLRELAIYWFGQFAPQGETAIPFLIQRLYDEKYWVRRAAWKVLGKFGPKAEGAVPKLIDMWKNNPNSEYRDEIANALESITGEDYP